MHGVVHGQVTHSSTMLNLEDNIIARTSQLGFNAYKL